LPFLDLVAICYQFKYSAPSSTTKLTRAIVEKTVAKCLGIFSKSKNHTDIREEKILVVFVAFREARISADELPKNVAILNRQSLEALYGPSLIHRPQFLAGVLARSAVDVDARDSDSD